MMMNGMKPLPLFLAALVASGGLTLAAAAWADSDSDSDEGKAAVWMTGSGEGDEDCEDDDGGTCATVKAPAKAGTVAPPANGLFGTGKPPVAVTR